MIERNAPLVTAAELEALLGEDLSDAQAGADKVLPLLRVVSLAIVASACLLLLLLS